MDLDAKVIRRERISGGSLTKLFDNVAAFRQANEGVRVVTIPTKRRDPTGIIYDVDVEMIETRRERLARATKPPRVTAPPTPVAGRSDPARTE